MFRPNPTMLGHLHFPFKPTLTARRGRLPSEVPGPFASPARLDSTPPSLLGISMLPSPDSSMPFSVHSIYRQTFKVWRRRRFDLFLRLLRPSPSDQLLDVGGLPDFWTAYPQPVGRIDTVNVSDVKWPPEASTKHSIRTFVGDGCSLPMPSQSYDIGFSNSVIEHVGSWDRQKRFASEIRRVANALWVQTPAFECPIEPHYLAPCIHYLPHSVQKRLLRWCTPWGWIEHPNQKQIDDAVETTRLLSKAEMQLLFPDCEILIEYLMWFVPKSYIAIRRKT